MYEKEIEERILESIRAKEMLLHEKGNISKAVEKIVDCYRHDGKLLIFGNGGSAADAQHFATELVNTYMIKDRKSLAAIALTTNSSTITSWANDHNNNFEGVFERQVEALAQAGDILIGLSTSGNSKNVINALRKGRIMGTYNISFTGYGGGKAKAFSDLEIISYSNNTGRIQECHLTAYHIICELVEKELFGKKDFDYSRVME